MTLLSWDIPLISFNGSLWDVLLRCSKWLLGAWLDSFTMILRCWLVVWVKWARPLVSMTLWSRVLFNWKAVNWKDGPFHGPSYTIEVNGANFSTLLPPRGATFTPFWGMVLQSLPASSNVANFTFLWIHSLSYEASIFFRNVKSMGQIWDAPAPRVQLLPHFEVWSYRACQPLEMWQISHFCEIHFLSYEASKFFSMLSQCVWFCPYFAPGANIVPPIAYKSHSTRFPIRPHVLTPHSWLCDKTVGGVARRNKSGRRIIISMSNNNTVLCH